ncbi:hypothetical protein SAMN02910298_02558 [Pseudobutyrivibrio sp. YE44]|uniref:hypothetical protein n=1 Tax=Pseudobutyrivibrio sp. YE44 TaxID=1520802 RepID=UPI0008909C5A|nr:hypothetical protein [Pseudobutyrivibrio sp. YE44]SDB50536.1 hypothetical protein SAMN02910298_02558 [Pseudobutyrivibrio sp. YE44]
MNEKKVTGFDFLWCSLYACAAFMIELILVFIEEKMGLTYAEFTVSQNITHWLITIALWVVAGILVIRYAKKSTGFDIWEQRTKLKGWQYVAILVSIAVITFAQYLDWGGFKVSLEWQRLGAVKFIFQYIYYLAESFLISLVIIYGQLACEKWFKNEKIPYGGIILGLTWGLGHILSKGSVLAGIFTGLSGVLFGAAYLFTNRDYRKAYPLIALLFIL